MPFPIKTCALCSREFELRPGKPGFANRCYECSAEDEETGTGDTASLSAEERKAQSEVDAARRAAIRDLLYKKDR
jgi:hypothetical protein